MTITIGSFTCNALTAQPFGYEGEAREGLTARTFQVAGLLTPTQWQALITEYNTWRNLRITDADTLSSGTVGTTVNLTITPANGLSVTNLPCWFVEPPSGDQAGAYISARVVMVDAAQALAVLLRSQEKQRQQNEATIPSFGTLTYGQLPNQVIITLTAEPNARQDGPQVALSATGTSYVTGPLKAHKIRNVEGYISTGTFANLLSWYDATILNTPQPNAWFPITPPTATAEVIITGGVKATRYNVTMTELQIL